MNHNRSENNYQTRTEYFGETIGVEARYIVTNNDSKPAFLI